MKDITSAEVSAPRILQDITYRRRVVVINFWAVYVIVVLVACMLVAVCEFQRKRRNALRQAYLRERALNSLGVIDDEITSGLSERSKYERMEKIEKKLLKTTMTVGASNLVEREDDIEINVDDVVPSSFNNATNTERVSDALTLQICTNSLNGNRIVSATCAICLSQYEVNDLVTHSSNSKCQHIFHNACLLEWFEKDKKYECPCCRQAFWTNEGDEMA